MPFVVAFNGCCAGFFKCGYTIAMQQENSQSKTPRLGGFTAAEPLWQLAPARSAQGRPVADFMMLIPRLRHRGPAFAEHAAQVLQAICRRFDDQVYFADLNLRTGAIWVSVAARPGLCREVAGAIRAELPQALTVGGQLGAVQGGLIAVDVYHRAFARISRIRQRVLRRLLPSPPDSGIR